MRGWCYGGEGVGDTDRVRVGGGGVWGGGVGRGRGWGSGLRRGVWAGLEGG